MIWSFDFSLWFVNGVYVSNYNASLHRTPDVIEIDDCGPANLISAGFALWLVLVPAVACVAQLPGSLILYQRSNFYRFSPELGLVETLAVLSLLTKALWKGYRWDESIAAVFAVRDGIGQGDLWWRKDLEAMFPADETPDDSDTLQGQGQGVQNTSGNQAQDSSIGEVGEVGEVGHDGDVGDVENDENDNTTVTSVDDDDGSSDTPDDRIRNYLNSKLSPRLEPLSQERILGAGLFLVAFVKTIAMIPASSNSGVRLSCYLALAYSSSYLVLEVLTWSYIFPLRNNSIRNVPPENLLEVVKYVDPGNNPFTFPSGLDDDCLTTSIPMTAIASPSQNHSLPTRTFAPYLGSAKYPWNKSVAVITATLGFLGPLTWLVVLSNIYNPAYGAIILSCAAAAFLILRLGGNWAYHILRQTLLKPKPQQQPSTSVSTVTPSPQTNVDGNRSTTDPESTSQTPIPLPPRDPFVQYDTHGIVHFFAIWLWRRITTVNLYSSIWVALTCYYFARVFPLRAGLAGDTPEDMVPQKPKWLDWLG